MSDYDRLLACGYNEQITHRLLVLFLGDPEGLEAFIRNAERAADV